MINKKFVFWTTVDITTKFTIENNPSLPEIAERFPYVFVCSNGIDKEVKDRVGNNVTIVETKNDHGLKGTAAFEKMREMDFDICIRLDSDAIVFDLDSLIKLASKTGPKQLLGNMKKQNWIKEGKKYRRKFIRGGCHAVGRYIVDNIAPLGFGRTFDRFMNDNTQAIGGELIGVKLFEMNDNYTGHAPVWHPRRKKPKPKWRSMIQNAELWRSKHQGG